MSASASASTVADPMLSTSLHSVPGNSSLSLSATSSVFPVEVAKKIVKAINLSLTNLFSLFPSVWFVQLSIYCCLFLRFVRLIDFFGIDHSLLLLC